MSSNSILQESGNSTQASRLSTEEISEQFGYILSTSTQVVEQTLRCMTARELNTCAQVCRLWNSVSQRIKKSRKDVVWCFHLAPNPDRLDFMIPSTRSSVRGYRHRESMPEAPYNATYEVGDDYYEVIDNAWSEPVIGLIFSTQHVCVKPHRYFLDFEDGVPKRRRKKKKKVQNSDEDESSKTKFYDCPVVDHMAKSLPKSCFVLFCCTSGIVGTPYNNQVPIEAEHNEGLSGVFLPNIPGVEFYPFNITELNIMDHLQKPSLDPTAVEQLTGIPDGKNVKCLMMFVHEHVDDGSVQGSLIRYFLSKQNMRLALGGAIVDELSAPLKTGDDSYAACIGLAVAGDNVSAASVVLTSHMRSEKVMEDKLLDLKNSGVSSARAVGFMFACCGRGENFHKKSNVEANLFHKYFPGVPLFGLFGNGEIGHNYLPKEVKGRANTRKKESWLHSFSTVFVLLSFQNSQTVK